MDPDNLIFHGPVVPPVIVCHIIHVSEIDRCDIRVSKIKSDEFPDWCLEKPAVPSPKRHIRVDPESPLLSFVIEIHGIYGAGVKPILVHQVLRSVDMSQGYQVIPRRQQSFLGDDRLKLRQHHRLPAFRIAPRDGIMRHKDFFLTRSAPGPHSGNDIGEFLREHLIFFLAGEAGELCPVNSPVKSRKNRYVSILKCKDLRRGDNMHIRNALEHFGEDIKLSCSVMVRRTAHDHYLIRNSRKLLDIVDCHNDLFTASVRPEPANVEHITGNQREIRMLLLCHSYQFIHAAFRILCAEIYPIPDRAPERPEMPVCRM